MATQKQDGLFTDTGESAADLTDKEFYFCKRETAGISLAGDGDVIAGVISQGRTTGKHTSFNTGGGWLKVIAGSAISIGDNVQSDADGKAKTGSTNPFGKARNAAAAGEFVEVVPDRV
jgi:fructose-1,6-bisphosphatase/sedoheptulose 1,7-bisphosphatase-like protein